ncbi:MAG: tetratricopeptide repeat protein, partial [Planctomycetota bacterium]
VPPLTIGRWELDERSKRGLIVGALLALAVFGAFASGLGGDFTNWDDDWLVVDNPWIKDADATAIGNILNPWVPERIRNQLGAEYLPLRDLSYMADDALHGLHPAGYHVSSLLIHILAVLALAAAVWRFTRMPALAIGTAAVFGLHPVQVECVTWIAGRKDVLAGLCGALGALCWARARETRGAFPTGAYLGSIVFCLLAVTSKYTAMVWPAMLIVGELLAPPRGGLRGTRFQRAAWLAPHLLVVVVFVAGIAVPVASRGLIREEWYGSGYAASFATAGVAICAYLQTIALPFPLQTAVDFPVFGDTQPAIAWSCTALVLLTIAAAVALAVRLVLADPKGAHAPRAAAAAMLLFLGALFPMSNVVNAIGTLYAERYLYLAMIGVGIGLGAVAQWAWRRRAGQGRVVLGVLGAAGLLWGVTAAFRAPAWDGSVAIWEDVLAKDAVHHTAHFNLGNHYFVQATKRRGEGRDALLAKAETLQRLAVQERHRSFYSIPERAESALALTRSAQGEITGPDGALEWYARALQSTRTAVAAMPEGGRDRGPRERFMAEILANRGQVLAQMGRTADALADFDAALALRGDLGVAHLNKGIVLGRTAGKDDRKLDDAVAALQEAINLQPRNVEAMLNLVALYLQRRRPAKALAVADRALRIAPDSVEARFYRGIVLGNTGRTSEARALFEAMVVESDPLARGAGALGLGTVYEQEGDIAMALRAYFAATRDPILQRSVALGGIKVRLRGVMMQQAESIWKNDELDIVAKQEQMLPFLEVAAQMGSESAKESGRNAAYNLGSRAYNKGTPEDLERARGYFERCAAIDPESAKAYLGLAAVARKQEDPHGVAAALSEALQIEDASDEAREEIVYQAAGFEAARALLLWNDGNGDMDEVREALGNAERLDPKHRSLLQIRAQIESTDERGDFAVALAAAETLAKLTEHGND